MGGVGVRGGMGPGSTSGVSKVMRGRGSKVRPGNSTTTGDQATPKHHLPFLVRRPSYVTLLEENIGSPGPNTETSILQVSRLRVEFS